MKIALVHDFLTQYGGAERFLEAIYWLYRKEEIRIFTLKLDLSKFPDSWKSYPITQMAANLPFVDYYPQIYAPYLVPVIEQADFTAYDVVISSDLIFSKFVICQPNTAHISYQHTPSRNLYPYADANKSRSWLFQAVSIFQKSFLRSSEYIATSRIDRLLTNSQTTAERIWSYYKRYPEVIYSFVDVPSDEEFSRKFKAEGDYFLCVARLVPDKRLELAVQACSELQVPLIVVGEGDERTRLEQLAGVSVEFTGQITDLEKQRLYAKCKALLVPGLEDFGLTPIEAMAWGKPVIAYGDGGVAESVVSGKTGELFYKQSVEEISRLISEFDFRKYSPDACRDQARKFSRQSFEVKIKSIVDEVLLNQ